MILYVKCPQCSQSHKVVSALIAPLEGVFECERCGKSLDAQNMGFAESDVYSDDFSQVFELDYKDLECDESAKLSAIEKQLISDKRLDRAALLLPPAEERRGWFQRMFGTTSTSTSTSLAHEGESALSLDDG